MNCRNCGAAMELFAERRYYFCEYCGTFEFLPAPADDGVNIVPRRGKPRPCPLCAAPLTGALLDRTYRVEHCESCRGLLLGCGDFARAVEARRARASGPPITPMPVDRRELERHLTCPSCNTTMDVHPYYGPGNIVIDTCSRCDLAWLDYGELKQVTDAPGRDRGRGWEPES